MPVFKKLVKCEQLDIFQKEVVKFLINHINEKDIKDLKEIFTLIDKDNNGLISPNELKEAIN